MFDEIQNVFQTTAQERFEYKLVMFCVFPISPFNTQGVWEKRSLLQTAITPKQSKMILYQ